MTDAWQIAGRYRVLDRIGSGGMADVFRAFDELLHREVAVKVFRAVPSTPDTASGVQRQHAELHALAQLNHPNLTTLYDGSIVGQDGPAYLVMELIDGPSLAGALESGPLPHGRVREIGAQIADALAYVHGAGMVHRDVKPANVLLGRDGPGGGRARLTDFGIVRLVGQEPLTRVDMTLGSASYLAPEQARGSAVGPPADVYALGLTLLEAVSGVRSFEGPALEAVAARLHRDPVIPDGLRAPLPGLLRAMTDRDPARRPTAGQVRDALSAPGSSAATALLAVVPPRVSTVPPVSGPARHVRGWLIAGGVALLALATVGGVLLAAGSGGDGTTPAPSTTPSPTVQRTRSSASTKPATPSSTPSSAPSTTAGPSRPASTPPTAASSTPPSSPATVTRSTPTATTTSSSPAANP